MMLTSVHRTFQSFYQCTPGRLPSFSLSSQQLASFPFPSALPLQRSGSTSEQQKKNTFPNSYRSSSFFIPTSFVPPPSGRLIIVLFKDQHPLLRWHVNINVTFLSAVLLQLPYWQFDPGSHFPYLWLFSRHTPQAPFPAGGKQAGHSCYCIFPIFLPFFSGL